MSTAGDVLAQASITSTVALVRYIKTAPEKASPSAIDVALAAWNAPESVLFVPDKGMLLADWLVSTLTPRAQPPTASKGKVNNKGKKPANVETVEGDRLSHWALLKCILEAQPQLTSVLASRHAGALIRAAELFASRTQALVATNSFELAASVGPTLASLVDPTSSAGATTATARERLPVLAETIAQLLSAAAVLPASETEAEAGICRVLQSVLASYLPAFAQAAPARREPGIETALGSFDDCATLSARETPKHTGKRKRSSSDDGSSTLASQARSFIYDTFFLPETLRTLLSTPEKTDMLQRVIAGAASGTKALALAPGLLTVLTARLRALPIELPKKEDAIRKAVLQFLSQLVSAVGSGDAQRSLLLAQTVSAASQAGLYRPGPDLDRQGTSWASILSTVLGGSLERLGLPGSEGRTEDLQAVYALWLVDSGLASARLGVILRALWLTTEAGSMAAAEPLLAAVFSTARRARGVPQLAVALMDAAHEASALVPDLLGSVSVPTTPWAIVLRAEALQSLPATLAAGLAQALAQRQTARFAHAQAMSWAIEAYLAAQILHAATLAPDAGGLQAWIAVYDAMGNFGPRVQDVKKVKQGEDVAVVRAALALWGSADVSLSRAKSAMPPSAAAQESYLPDMDRLATVAQSISAHLPHLHNIFKAATDTMLRLDLADTLVRGALDGQLADPSKVVLSVLECVESPNQELSLGVWQIVARWAVGLDRFPPATLAPVARGLVKAWDGSDARQLRILRLTAGNAQFVELASFRDAVVEAALEKSSKAVRDATKLAGARHFPRLYWGPSLPRIQAAARQADAALIANGSFTVAGHVRELLAQTQVQGGSLLCSADELAALVAPATKAKDLRPATALVVRSWVYAQAASSHRGGQEAIKAARVLLDQHPWVLYTFSSSVMRFAGRSTHAAGLLAVDESAFTRVRHAIKGFAPSTASDDDARALERAVRDGAVSCTLGDTGRDVALPAGFLSSLAAERATRSARADALDGVFLALMELFVASRRTEDLTTTYVHAREAVYLSGVSGSDEGQTAVYRTGLAMLPPADQAAVLLTLTAAFTDDLDVYLVTESPGLAVRVAARLDALAGCIVALEDDALAHTAMARLLSAAALACTASHSAPPAPVLALALAKAAASMVRAHHRLFDHTLVQHFLALAAGLLAPAGAGTAPTSSASGTGTGPPLSRAWTSAALHDLLAALGLLMRQRRKELRPVLGALGSVLALALPLLRVEGQGGRPGWVCSGGLGAPATAQLAASLSRTLEAVTAKGVSRDMQSMPQGQTAKAASAALAQDFAPHAHALLAVYARSLLGVEGVARSPLDRPRAVALSGHVAPETQRALEPGLFALCDSAALAPAGRDAALTFHLAPPAKAVLKRIWSTWEAQRYKGQ